MLRMGNATFGVCYVSNDVVYIQKDRNGDYEGLEGGQSYRKVTFSRSWQHPSSFFSSSVLFLCKGALVGNYNLYLRYYQHSIASPTLLYLLARNANPIHNINGVIHSRSYISNALFYLRIDSRNFCQPDNPCTLTAHTSAAWKQIHPNSPDTVRGCDSC
jgi:hypothetical protein